MDGKATIDKALWPPLPHVRGVIATSVRAVALEILCDIAHIENNASTYRSEAGFVEGSRVRATIEIDPSLSPQERWRQHDTELTVIQEFEEARRTRDAGLQKSVISTGGRGSGPRYRELLHRDNRRTVSGTCRGIAH